MDFAFILLDNFLQTDVRYLHDIYKIEATSAFSQNSSNDETNSTCTYEDFFNNCDSVIKEIKSEMQKQFEKDIDQTQDEILKAKSDNDFQKVNELLGSKNNFLLRDTKINLSIFCPTIQKTMRYYELKYIEDALAKAKKEFISEEKMTDIETINGPYYENNLRTGIKTKYTIQQLTEIHKDLTIGSIKYKTIFIEASIKDFLAICSDETLPKEFKRVKWVLMSRVKKPTPLSHKDALREFLLFLYGSVPKKQIVKSLFSDKNNADITPNKSNKTRFSSHYLDLENIFNIN
ncbi:MAG: hypothetical protein WCP69_13055 [Bacteroidota bacterium]